MKFNNLSKTFIVVFLSLTSIFCACGKKEEGNVKVETKSITEITASSAKSGGNVTVKNGITVEACGICWDENSNPTINDCFTNDSQQEGEYVSTMENLKAETKYYVRAYANTSSGVMYGDEKSFTTTANGGGNGGNGGNGGIKEPCQYNSDCSYSSGKGGNGGNGGESGNHASGSNGSTASGRNGGAGGSGGR